MNLIRRHFFSETSLCPIFVLLAVIPDWAGAADNIATLGAKPRWNVLEHYQQTITREEFSNLVANVYCTHGMPADMISIAPDSARILMNRDSQCYFTLRFAADAKTKEHVPRLWRLANSLGRASETKPLGGLRVALDPGHIGGKWAKMEERWFQVGDSSPVEEAEIALRVAKLLAPKLRALGAEVTFVRSRNRPATPKRPDDFREIARMILAKSGVNNPSDSYENGADENKEKSIRWQSELLFYRQSEIRYRARRVNEVLQPDLVLCLHFNAEAWGDPKNPTLIDRDHFHVLVNGSYLPAEIDRKS